MRITAPLTTFLSLSPHSRTSSRQHQQTTCLLLSSVDDTITGSTTDLEVTAMNVPLSRYDDLLDWLRKGGAEISSKLSIQPSEKGGYGAFVTETVKADEVLFRIPRSLCVTIDDALTDEECGEGFRTLIEKAGPGGNTVGLAGILAKEHLRSLEFQEGKLEADSKFGPYLATLPWKRGLNAQEHILYWNKDMIEDYLKGSMCYGEALDLRQEVGVATSVLNTIAGTTVRRWRGEVEEKFWPWEVSAQKAAIKAAGLVEGLDAAVRGAFVCILTRAFEDVAKSDDNGEKLVPLLDLLQHSDEPNIRHVMQTENDNTVQVTARNTLEPGTELLNQYRSELEESMPYSRFFTRFGFVPGIPPDELPDLLRDQSSIFFAQKREV